MNAWPDSASKAGNGSAVGIGAGFDTGELAARAFSAAARIGAAPACWRAISVQISSVISAAEIGTNEPIPCVSGIFSSPAPDALSGKRRRPPALLHANGRNG